MQVLKTILVIVFALGFAAPAHSVFDREHLLSLCLSDNVERMFLCDYFIWGYYEGLLESSAHHVIEQNAALGVPLPDYATRPVGFCMSEPVSANDISLVVRDYMASHYSDLPERGGAIVTRALQDRFACSSPE